MRQVCWPLWLLRAWRPARRGLRTTTKKLLRSRLSWRSCTKETKSPLNTLKAALKGNSPDWESVQKEAKLFKKYGDALPKNDPPRGKKEAYEKLAKAYAASAKSLEEAAEKENLKGARDALKKIQGSCTACHKSHKPA